MKNSNAVLLAVLFISFLGFQNIHAQNFAKTNPSFTRMLADTSYATVMELTFLPGVTTTSHTHPAQFLYALTDGTLHIVHGDGKVEDMVLKAGDNFLVPPLGPHMTTNPGTKPFKMLAIEFNDHPYKKNKK